MKNKRKFLMIVLIVVFVITAACGASNEESATSDEHEANNVPENTDELKNSSVDTVMNEVEENEEQEEKTEQEINEKKPSESQVNNQITSGEEAAQYLKQQLEEGADDEISFGATDTVDTDDYGSYYTVQLVDIPLRVSGKTGTLGYYKVYEDGKYETFQMTDIDIANNNKEEYLKKLHDIEKELEKLQENSEAVTTLEMKEEEAYRYETWDIELNKIYGVLKQQLSKEQMEKLREEQRNWINQRDETAKKASQKYEGGSMESLNYLATQADLTKERCFELVENYME